MATQLELIDLILTMQSGQVIVVEAEAGSGKTHSVMDAIFKLPESATVFVAAPTHVAVEELASKLVPGTKCNTVFGTSASLAGRYLQLNRDTGEMENRFAPKSISYDLIVMDEVAATPACDVTRVLQSLSPVVMLGDRQQLEAVRSRTPDIWTEGWVKYGHRSFTFVGLEGQHRATGPLYEFQRAARLTINTWTRSFNGGRMFYNVAEFEDDFIDIVTEAYSRGKDLSQYCMFAYRNTTVNRLQSELRRQVFGLENESLGFAPGETVRCESMPNTPRGRLAQVLETISVFDTAIQGKTIKTCKVHLLMPDGGERWVTAVHPVHLDSYRELMENCKTERNWPKFFALEEHFSVIVNANVMTTHKAQGRSVKFCWTHVADIGSRQKLLYVAHSRASQTLTGVWPSELWGWQKKFFANTTKEQLDAERNYFVH